MISKKAVVYEACLRRRGAQGAEGAWLWVRQSWDFAVEKDAFIELIKDVADLRILLQKI